MNKNEALKMAIDYLDGSYEAHKVRKACKEALEQPAQEPVALIFPENRWYIPSPLDKDEKQIEFNRGFAQGFNDCILHVKLHNQKPLYTHPAPSWQGLSQEEQWNLINKSDIPADYDHEILAIARAIEQALRNKNGY